MKEQKLRMIFNESQQKLSAELGAVQSITAIILLSLFLAALQYICRAAASPTGILSFLAVPLLPLMNALPLICVMLFIYAVTNRIWAGYLAAAVPLFALLTINWFKVYFRSETLSMHDFSLASEAVNIMTGYSFPVPVTLIISIILAAAGFAAVFICVKNAKIPVKQRLLLIIISAAVGVGVYSLCGNRHIYEKLPSFSDEFNDVSEADHKGFLFTFLSNTSAYEYERPHGFDMRTVVGESEPDAVSAPEQRVNIIAVMSEAFFDMEACEDVQFYDGMSPTPNLSRLRADSLWGHILVPGYAGSTASTEFEFLTGINIARLDSAMPVVYKTHVTQNAYSLAQMLSDIGYTTEAFHPGHAWFYNRAAVYPRLGFQNAYFDESFEYSASDLVNYYVSDKITADKITDEFGDHIRSGANNGYFSFTVTIQNHGPYSSNEPELKRLKRTAAMSDDEYNRLCNYANGLYDADALLGRICDYAETTDEPTVVLFFGDHLPYFDAEGLALTHLGLDVNSNTPEAMENRYSTPFIIHGNAAFRAMKNDVCENKEHISSCFLTPELLKYIGLDMPPYFDAISKIENSVSEISGSFYIAAGKHTTSLTPEQERLLTYYDYLSYWALREYTRK